MSDLTRIGLDCRLAGPDHAGIGRYIENLIWRLPQISGPKYHWVFFVSSSKQKQQLIDRAPSADWAKRVEFVIAPIRHYSWAEQWRLPSVFDQAHLDLLHVPHFNVPFQYSGRFLITIHDLLWHEYQGLGVTTLSPWVYWVKYLGYKMVAARAIRRAAAILVPSHSVRESLAKYYPQVTAPIIVTPEGVASTLRPLAQKDLRTNKNHILYVGSLYPHKNLEVVLQTVLLDRDLHLHVVSARSAFALQTQQRTKSLGLAKQISWHWQLPDDELRALYAQSLALIQPSKSEGFGLTGLEAMHIGIPVIAAETAVFQEVYDSAALFFNTDQPADLLAQIQTLQTDASRWDELRQAGRAWASKFSWDEMTKQTVAMYQHVLS
jgi:glycosyltransferase involved in cell wall biosynthesis